MDLSLPVLSGWEAARQIRADPATSHDPGPRGHRARHAGDRERALAAGCDGFIAKPIDEETFAARVDLVPCAARPAIPQRAVDAGPGLPRRASPGGILVVDDQPEVADLLKSDLEPTATRSSAPGARRRPGPVRRGRARFDLAVVDVMLGGGLRLRADGRLIAAGRRIPSGPARDRRARSTGRRGYAAGADDFIGKPIDSAELRARARSLIRIGRAIREQGASGERAEAYEKLAELDRLKSDFLSTVSHELRTPLNTIILLSHQIEKATGPAPEEAARQTRRRVISREPRRHCSG